MKSIILIRSIWSKSYRCLKKSFFIRIPPFPSHPAYSSLKIHFQIQKPDQSCGNEQISYEKGDNFLILYKNRKGFLCLSLSHEQIFLGELFLKSKNEKKTNWLDLRIFLFRFKSVTIEMTTKRAKQNQWKFSVISKVFCHRFILIMHHTIEQVNWDCLKRGFGRWMLVFWKFFCRIMFT